jgi:RNA polymerase sigma factor
MEVCCYGNLMQELTPDMSIRNPEESVMRQHMVKDIHNLLKSLDSRERQVLFLRYGLEDYQPKSLADTGRLLQVTKEWIRKVEKKALTKLGDEDIRRDLSHFLDI